jgi:Flp pilus assembly secretin CpaC
MSADACRSLRFRLLSVIVIVLIAAAPRLASAAPPEPAVRTSLNGPVTVHIDQAKIVKVPDRTATLVVGNPLIADASVQPGGIVVITAKSFGVTNLVALDRAGNVLMESPLQVLSPDEKTVVVYRGIDHETYSCLDKCERRITVGDTPGYFAANVTQVGAINSLALQQQQMLQR